MHNLTNAAQARPGGIDRHLPLRDSASGSSSSGSRMIDFTALRGMIWRQRFIVGGVVMLALLAGLVATLLATPMYEASSSVRVSDQTEPIIEGQNLEEVYIPSNEVVRYMQTLGGVIESRSMAFQVVDVLDLQDNAVLLDNMIAAGPPAGMSEDAWAAERREAAAETIRGALELDIPIDRRIISISIALPDPDLAAAVANGYANEFLSDDVRRGVDANAFAREYLEGEIAKTREALAAAETRANGYARTQGIITQSLPSRGEGGNENGTAQTIASANLALANEAYTAARARRIEAEQRWRTIANAPASDLPEVQQDPAIQALRTQRAQTAAELAQLQERYLSDHPSVQEASRQISELDAAIADAARSVKQSLRNQYQVAQRQEAALGNELSGFAEAGLDEQDRRVQLGLLTREVDALRYQLDTLLQRYTVISSAANLRSNDVSILDLAATPVAPSSPSLMSNLLIALVLGSGLALLLAVLRETIDDRIASFADVERRVGLPALGQTPFVSEGVDGDLAEAFSPISEAYSSIRATVDFSLPVGSKLLQFTSTQPGEGKTTTAIAVAQRFAEVGQKTLLVDMDLRRPSLARQLAKGNAGPGLLDVMLSQASLSDALISDPAHPGLDVLPIFTTPDNPVVVLSSAILPELLGQLASQYDRVVIDSSPVLGIADAPLISRHVDAVAFVVEANRTHARQVNAAMRRLDDMGANVAGIVLTKYRALDAGEYLSYQYRYYSYTKA